MSESSINAKALLDSGYREYPGNNIDGYDLLFQKRIDDDTGEKYFVNFREFRLLNGQIIYDAQMSCETDTGGYVWVTIKEASISETETRAASMWACAGGVFYDL